MKIQNRKSLLGARDIDNVNPFWCALRDFLSHSIGKLSNQHGYIDGDGNQIDDDEDDDNHKEPTKPEIDGAQVLAYLESQGLKFESLDQITNMRNSVSGLTKKAEMADKLQKQLQAIQQATSGGQPPSTKTGNELPEELLALSPATLKALDVAIKHYGQSHFSDIANTLRAEFGAGLFSSKHDGFSDHEEEFVKFLDEHGIQGRSDKTLDWAYKQFLAENKAGEDDANLPPGGGGGHPSVQPGNNRPDVKRVGLTPKVNARGGGAPNVKDISEAETDEEIQAAIDNFYESKE